MNQGILAATLAALLLAGCSTVPLHQDAPLVQGPAPKVNTKVPEGSLACVASRMKVADYRKTFGVLDFPDKTGAENRISNDGFGTFNTQGAADMLASSLMKTKVNLVELGPSFRAISDWSLNKTQPGVLRVGTVQTTTLPDGKENITRVSAPTNNVMFPSVGLFGAITSTDFLPGGGAQVGAFGAKVGYSQNRALTSLDLRAVVMSNGSVRGGKVIANSTVTKQISQDGTKVSFTRYLGPLAKPILVDLEIGEDRREAMKYSTREMIDLATADVLSQVFGIRGCMEEENIVASLN